ncbi:MAG TPA: SprT-like domain-containing protein [Geothermobacteraceae bacterium]|nr:SprT-like domain-containing protein [Geothermobacteraceae bacterium]
MQHKMTVASCAAELDVAAKISSGIATLLPPAQAKALFSAVMKLPVRSSRALRSLGSYISKGGRPVCIRLQFRQERELLAETLLHEIAHLCDHLSNQHGRPYRQAHGPGWQSWAEAFGISARRTGKSQVLCEIHEQRLKLVAVCLGCGLEVRRLRRLNRGTRYIHPGCGGRLQPVDVS